VPETIGGEVARYESPNPERPKPDAGRAESGVGFLEKSSNPLPTRSA